MHTVYTRMSVFIYLPKIAHVACHSCDYNHGGWNCWQEPSTGSTDNRLRSVVTTTNRVSAGSRIQLRGGGGGVPK